MAVGKHVSDARKTAAKKYYHKHKAEIIRKREEYNRKWRKGLVGHKHKGKKKRK